MKTLLILCAALLLSACADNNNNNSSAAVAPPPAPAADPNLAYEVSIVNLTAGQPFSPVAAIFHPDSVTVFSIGQPASVALEVMAEGGDNSQLLEAIDGAGEVSGGAPLGPGATETLSLELNTSDASAMRLTVLTMLVNTNDAFTGVNSADVSALEVGQSMTLTGRSYDAGTEANSEAAGTMPGPADGGEGFNEARDDIADQVTGHGGAVTADDGLSISTLSQLHRWDDPVARFSITRTQ